MEDQPKCAVCGKLKETPRGWIIQFRHDGKYQFCGQTCFQKSQAAAGLEDWVFKGKPEEKTEA